MIHSYGQKILYPWSYTKVRLHDWEDMQRMGQIMARAIEYEDRDHNDYSVGSAPHTQYLASGGSDDWARGSMGIKWVFLMELPDAGYHGFLLPAKNIVPVGRSIFEGIRALAVKVSHTLVY
jgi:carboxypeptidase A4